MQKNGEKMKKLKSIMPGTAVCAVIAAAATLTGGISIGGFSFELIGAPVIAILLGMILTLVFPKLASLTSLSGGIKFTSKKILQWAVVILGFSLNLSTIAQVGAKSLPVIVGTISISLIVAFIMMKLMTADQLAEELRARGEVKGEIALVIAPPSEDEEAGIAPVGAAVADPDDALREDIRAALEEGEPASAVAKRLSQKYSRRKRDVYAMVLDMQ